VLHNPPISQSLVHYGVETSVETSFGLYIILYNICIWYDYNLYYTVN